MTTLFNNVSGALNFASKVNYSNDNCNPGVLGVVLG